MAKHFLVHLDRGPADLSHAMNEVLALRAVSPRCQPRVLVLFGDEDNGDAITGRRGTGMLCARGCILCEALTP